MLRDRLQKADPHAPQALSLRVGTLNANGIKHAFAPLLDSVRTEAPDLLAVVETYRSDTMSKLYLKGYKVMESRMTPGTTRSSRVNEDSHGVALLIRNEWAQVVRPIFRPHAHFADSLWVKIPRNSALTCGFRRADGSLAHGVYRTECELWIGVYYLAPRLPVERVRQCADEICDMARRARAVAAEVVLLGDLNCNLRAADDPLRRRDISHRYVSAKEACLMEVLAANHLISLHTLVPKHPLYTYTRKGVGWSMRDYMIVPETSLAAKQWSKPTVASEWDLDSDHWMVYADRKTVATRVAPGSFEAVPQGDNTVERVNCTSQRNSYHRGWKVRAPAPRRRTPPATEQPRSTEASQTQHQSPQTAQRTPAKSVPGINSPVRTRIRSELKKLGLCDSGDATSVSEQEAEVLDYDEWNRQVSAVLDEVVGRNSPADAAATKRSRKMPSFVTDTVRAAVSNRRKAYRKLKRVVNRASNSNDNKHNDDSDDAAGGLEAAYEKCWDDFVKARTHSHSVIAKAKKDQWEAFLTEINDTPRDGTLLWRLLERALGSSAHKWTMVRDDSGELISCSDTEKFLRRWENYYRRLGSISGSREPRLKADVEEEVVANATTFFADAQGEAHSAMNECLNTAFKVEEVKKALHELPYGKAIGVDGYSNEILRALGSKVLTRIMNALWSSEEIPKAWGIAIIHPLPKSGDLTDLGNTRGISLLSCMSKLFEALLRARLQKFLEDNGKLVPEQGGFRAARECVEHVATLHEALRRRREAKLPSYVGFIDFAKAFDTVWRRGLLFKLHRMGVQGKMLRMIAALYQDTRATVRVDGQYTETFPIEMGVRQGGVLSPLLFLVFINDLLDRMKEAKLGVTIPGLRRDSPFAPPPLFPGLMWADDVVLVTSSHEKLQQAFHLVDKWCADWGMSVNPKKSNVMLITEDTELRSEWEALAASGSARGFQLGGGEVLATKSYRYLGVQIHESLDWQENIALRIKAIHAATFRCCRILRNAKLDVALRRRYFETMIMSTASWGAEIWAGEKKVCKKIDTAVSRALRLVVNMPSRVSRIAIGWELGYVPFHLRVAARRTSLLLKWRRETLTPVAALKETSGLWARRIFQSESSLSGKSWSWARKTVNMTRKWLGMRALAEFFETTPRANAEPPAVRVAESREKASLAFYRDWARAKSSRAGKLILALHASDEELCLSPYLSLPGMGDRFRTLLLCRTGGLVLNDQVSKFAPERRPECYSCGSGAKETFEHFLLECAAYAGIRAKWADSWKVPVELLTLQKPDSSSAALGESLHIWEDAADAERVSIMHRARIDALSAMFILRSARLTTKSLGIHA